MCAGSGSHLSSKTLCLPPNTAQATAPQTWFSLVLSQVASTDPSVILTQKPQNPSLLSSIKTPKPRDWMPHSLMVDFHKSLSKIAS